MVSAFTTYRERDRRPNVRVEVQAPLAWWDSSYGLRRDVFDKVFGHLRLDKTDCSGERPPAEPPLAETVTGALARRRPPRQAVSKTPPEAGKGPAQAGDVYAVRVRDGAPFLRIGGRPDLIQDEASYYDALRKDGYGFFCSADEDGYLKNDMIHGNMPFCYGALYLYAKFEDGCARDVVAGFWQCS
jgi:hypothetical protein